MRRAVQNLPRDERVAAAYKRAAEICDEDVETCRRIGEHGRKLIEDIAAKKGKGEKVEVLTHCNAGWLACVDWGTATSPIYQAHDAGVPLHVWVDETRPRNQGAALTAFELGSHGVPHTIVVDNAGGHLMQHGKVDMVIVGTDRVAANGDVANKIGTYLKALAAHDNDVPFYVALPHSTIDWTLDEGLSIPIEERSADEVLKMPGRLPDGTVVTVEIAAPGSPAGNPAFDVTPARLVTGFITERGVCPATREGLLSLYPERGGGIALATTFIILQKKVWQSADPADVCEWLSRERQKQRRRKRGTPRGHRHRARDEPFRPVAGPLGQCLAPLERRHAHHADRHGLRGDPSARHRLRRRQGCRAGQAQPQAVERVALPPRRLPRAARHARCRAHALAAMRRCSRARTSRYRRSTTWSRWRAGTTSRSCPTTPSARSSWRDYVAQGLATRNACLMANHGQIAIGAKLCSALELAHEVEVLAAQYVKVLTLGGEPHILPDEEMARVLERFKNYGQRAQG